MSYWITLGNLRPSVVEKERIKFPRFGKLAKKCLAVSATSIPSERTFSTAGLTVTKLDAGKVDQIVFLTRIVSQLCFFCLKME